MQTLYWNRNNNQVYTDRYGKNAAQGRALRGEDAVQVILLQGTPAVPVQVPTADVVGLVVRDPLNLKAGCLAGPSVLTPGGAAADGYSGGTSTDTTLTRGAMNVDPANATAELPSYAGSAVVYHLPAGATQADESIPFPWTIAANYLRPDQPPADVVATYPPIAALALTAAQAALVPYAYRDYSQNASDAIDGMLAGKTPGGATIQLFSAADYTNGVTFTRNPALFCGDYDFTAFSPWNSTEGAYQGGTAITRRHALLADHFSDPVLGTPPMSIGTVLAFIDNTNVVYQRSITAFNRIGTTDLLIATLDSDLPPSITPATVLPGGLAPELFPAGTAVLYANQAKTIHVGEVASFAAATIASAAAANRAPWTTAGPGVGGDSGSPVYLALGGQAVLWFLFHSPNGGGDLPGANVAAINAVLQQAGSQYALTVANLPALGSAAFRGVAGGTGAAACVDPATGQLPGSMIPPLGTPGNVEQTWNGLADATIPLGTTLLRGSYNTVSAARTLTLTSGSQTGRTIELLMPRIHGGGSVTIAYVLNGSPITLSLPVSTSNTSLTLRYLLEFGANGFWSLSSFPDGYDLSAVSGRRSGSYLSYAAAATVDFNLTALQYSYLTGDLALTSLNLNSYRTVRLLLIGDTVARNVSFPAGWTFLGAPAPTTLAANKQAVLDLTAWSQSDAGVTATWNVQP